MNNPVIGLTSGCFDLLHTGHLRYLQRCKDQCDKLIVAIEGDEIVRSSKGEGRPIYPARERKLIIEALKCVDITAIIKKREELNSIIEIFQVKKVFQSEISAQLYPIVGDHEATAESVLVRSIPYLPETSLIINKIVDRFKHFKR
jgi:cytidyltransferase-like protein